MSNVLGPYDRCDWWNMLKIKRNLNWYLQQTPFTAFETGYKKEELIFNYLRTKST